MRIEKLSEKQKTVLKFAHNKKYRGYNALICDGAVRSGKTAVMTLSFIHWAMRFFNKSYFAFCGKTIGSVERNIINFISQMTDITAFFSVNYNSTKHILTIKNNDKENYFYVFSGKDKGSAALIQGLTLCGVFFDEVALQPRSFVEQGIARTLSIPEAKLFFNCNPESPEHWFYKEWILNSKDKNALHIHFTMEDNPSLSKAEISRAKSLYSGVFKDRFVFGKWVASQGIVYPMFNKENIISNTNIQGEYYISIDYGTVNPFSMGLWVFNGETAVRLKEFYYNSRKTGRQLTDEEYYNELLRFSAGYKIKSIIIDPSAASFIQTVRRHRLFHVRPANNNVVFGIRVVSDLIKSKKILINENCKDIIREFSLYSWDENAEYDKVIKENDHALDELRYFCMTVMNKRKSKGKSQPSYYF